MSFWDGLYRLFFGFKKQKSLEEFIYVTKTVNDAIDYSKQWFTWEEDRIAEDEWQEPHKAFLSLQSPNTPSDCDEYAPVFGEWFKAHGYTYWLLGVWNSKEGHAICVYQDGNKLYWISNWKRPRWAFNSIKDICFDVYADAKVAKIAKWNDKLKKYQYVENINLKA